MMSVDIWYALAGITTSRPPQRTTTRTTMRRTMQSPTRRASSTERLLCVARGTLNTQPPLCASLGRMHGALG